MSAYINKILLSVSFVVFSALSSFSQASLITNGSFEQILFDDNSVSRGAVFNTDLQAYKNKRRAWDVFYRLPGWRTTYGNGIELQKNVVTKSQNGSHHVELDSHPRGASNAVMTQSLASLTIGADYLLEFYYKPRTNSANDNGINVYWYDAAIDFDFSMQAAFTAESIRSLTPNWAVQSVSFTAKSTSMDLSFASFGRQNTLGGLVDNVSLTQMTSVPEPSTFALFLAAAFGLLLTRRRKQIN
jgi:hypothetical protein